MLKAGFARVDITPRAQVDLAGYFNRRPSAGVLDPLHAKALVLGDGEKKMALVVLDLVGVPRRLTEEIRGRLSEQMGFERGAVLVCATHTHTGPAVVPLFEVEAAVGYPAHVLVPAVVDACRRALENAAPFTLRFGRTVENKRLAFNRRYWMKDGRVVTNPAKGSPDVVGPESPIDRQVQVFAFEQDGVSAENAESAKAAGRSAVGKQVNSGKSDPLSASSADSALNQDGRLQGIVVDANNHTDTVGGNMISADWPGRMAAALADSLGKNVEVMLLNGPAGNINHFDPDKHYAQTSYDEAKRVGRAYAEVALDALRSAATVRADSLAFAARSFFAPYRCIPQEVLEQAKGVARSKPPEKGSDLTSEDLAAGDAYVEWIFAQALLEFNRRYGHAEGEELEIGGFRLGDCAFVGLPGEPFSQVGMAIKEKSPFDRTTVFALCGDMAGYVPMPECFERGGYEPRTTPMNRFAPELAEMLIENALAVLHELKG